MHPERIFAALNESLLGLVSIVCKRSCLQGRTLDQILGEGGQAYCFNKTTAHFTLF